MKKPYLLCFFVFLLPALGCIGSVNAEQILLANLSDVTAQSSEDELGTVVFTLLEAITGAEVDTVVDEEGFGVIRYGFGYEPSALERAQGSLPPGFLDTLNCHSATKLLIEKAPEGSTLMEEKRGSATWCIVNVPFSNLLQLADHYQTIFNTATYAADLENSAFVDSTSSGQNEGSLEPKPLIQLQCLELVDGLFYQQFSIDETALEQDDTDLMEVFGINLQWRLSMPGDIRNHNAPAKLTFPLAWNMLDAPETLNVNLQPGDACPSSRLKLLLEFTTTDTTLATLTVPISRDAEDLGQNEDVRQRLAEQGWLTQIEGSANHAPRIVALRQFNQRELDQILATIPGVEGSAQVVRQISPQTDATNANETTALTPTDLPTTVRMDLDLSKFTNTWAELMPNLPPTAFELDVDSIRSISNLEGQWNDANLPYLLWNGASDDVERELALTITSDNFLPLAEAEVDAGQEEIAATEEIATTEETAATEEIAATVGVSEDEALAATEAEVVGEQSEALIASRLPERTVATRMTEENMQPLSVRVAQSPDESDGGEGDGEDEDEGEGEGGTETNEQPTATNTPEPTPTNTPEPTATNTPEPTATNTSEPTPTNTPEPTATIVPTEEPTEVPNPTATVASARVALANATSQDESGDLDRSSASIVTSTTQTEVDPGNAESTAGGSEETSEDGQSSKENRSALTVAALVRSASSTPKTVGSLTAAEGESSEIENSEAETGQTVGDLLDSDSSIADDEASDIKTISDLIENGQDDDANDSAAPDTEAAEQPNSSQPDETATDTAATDTAATDPAISLPQCTVVIEWLNLRPGPGLEYGDPIAPLPQGTELFVVAQDPSGFWIEVTAEEPPVQGWVSLLPEFVSCNGDLSATSTINLASFEPIESGSLPSGVSTGASSGDSSAGQDSPAVKALSDKD